MSESLNVTQLTAHPRAGGDDSRADAMVARLSGSSPRWRGRPACSRAAIASPRLIPALAGTTLPWVSMAEALGAHPRAGGDDSTRSGSPRTPRGSSPRWRGRLPGRDPGPDLPRLIPALAGTTRLRRRRGSSRRAHPRAGGDDSRRRPSQSGGRGSSPRWRGRLHLRTTKQWSMGLIPALAGTTQRPPPRGKVSRAHPRAGGDDLAPIAAFKSHCGSSPRWRGRPKWALSAEVGGRLIPALAGTTALSVSTRAGTTAHPRAGGDDFSMPPINGLKTGSSPRWRGRPHRTAAPPLR